MNIGIIGATGAVGRELIEIFNKDCKYDYKLFLFASDKSEGTIIDKYTVKKLSEEIFEELNFVFFCSTSEISKKYVPIAKKYNCISIDNSCAFRLDKDVPLIIPEINSDKIIKENLIYANPNCSTIILLMAIYPLYRKYGINTINVCTYQASSGAGIKGMKELENQTKSYINNEKMDTTVFGRQYAFNLFSHNSKVDLETGYNNEELKMIKETKKILDNSVKIVPMCIRVPILRSHVESVTVELKRETTLNEFKDCIGDFSGITIMDDRINNRFPEPINTSKKYEVSVGRFIGDYDGNKKKYQFIVSGDQLLKGASLNAYQIFNKLIDKFHK